MPPYRRILTIAVLTQVCLRGLVYGRAITLDDLDIYEVSIPSSVTFAERVYQADIKARKQQLGETKRQRQDANERVIEAKIETKQAEAKLEEAARKLETVQTEVNDIIQNIQETEEALFLRRLEASNNERLRDSVEQYRQLFKVFKDFESQYTLSIPENVAEDLKEIGLSEDDTAIIAETLQTFQAGSFDLDSVVEVMHRTVDNLSKIDALKQIIPLKEKLFSRPGRLKLAPDSNSYIDSNYDWLVLMLKRGDILDRFINDALSPEEPEKSHPVIPAYTVLPAWGNLKFHSFFPPDRDNNSPWKLHVSGKDYDAWKVLKYLLPHLIQNNRTFKVFESIMELHGFYYEGSLPQTGKLFTIYPYTDEESAELAKDLNDLMILTPFTQDNFPAVPNDVKIGSAPGIYGRYEGHSKDRHYDRLVPWGDDLNADRPATCPFVQERIDVQWVKDDEVWVESWDKRPTTWAHIERLKGDLERYRKQLNPEGQALIPDNSGAAG